MHSAKYKATHVYKDEMANDKSATFITNIILKQVFSTRGEHEEFIDI